jgi:hypothetical protein
MPGAWGSLRRPPIRSCAAAQRCGRLHTTARPCGCMIRCVCRTRRPGVARLTRRAAESEPSQVSMRAAQYASVIGAALSLCAVLSFAGALIAQVNAPGNGPKTAIAANTEWLDIGGDKASTRFAPLTQIDRSNVGMHRVAWRRPGVADELRARYPDVRAGSSRSTPLLVNGVLYAPNVVGPHPGRSGRARYASEQVQGDWRAPAWSCAAGRVA